MTEDEIAIINSKFSIKIKFLNSKFITKNTMDT
jgi:hypothetical protein